MTKGSIPIILHTIDKVVKGESVEFEKATLQSIINICQSRLNRLVGSENIKEKKTP